MSIANAWERAVQVSPDPFLVGMLDAWPLTDILTWLHRTQRTAMVRVGPGWNAGVLFFRDGELFRCEWGCLGGEPALLSLLGIRSGPFMLMQRTPPEAQPNVTRSTAELLFQLGMVMESKRAASA